MALQIILYNWYLPIAVLLKLKWVILLIRYFSTFANHMICEGLFQYKVYLVTLLYLLLSFLTTISNLFKTQWLISLLFV